MQELERYLHITTDGVISVVEFSHDVLIEKIHELCNCKVFECLALPHYGDLLMFCDEYALITNPPKRVNPVASMLYPGTLAGNYIYGDVLLGKYGYYDGEPDITGLYDPALNYFYKFLTNLKESYYGK